ncbi:hypothetical protein [Aeromicrobium sp. REDSEA-S32_B7]|nr:hypothetical protein [Aeromicrobium sp. REDSEA-S32_B7]
MTIPASFAGLPLDPDEPGVRVDVQATVEALVATVARDLNA